MSGSIPRNYAWANDFGQIVNEYWLPANPEQWPFLSAITKDMQEVARNEGFNVSVSEGVFYYPRDAFVPLKNRTVASGASGFSSSNLTKAIRRSVSKDIFFGGMSAATKSSHPSCKRKSQGGSVLNSLRKHAARVDYHQRTKKNFRPEFKFFVEGGDLFSLTNSEGKRKILIGEDIWTIVHNQWRLEKRLKPLETASPEAQKYAATLRKNLTKEHVKKVAQEMFAMGLLRFGEGDTGMIEVENITETRLGSDHQLAKEQGLIRPFPSNRENEEKIKEAVVGFFVQKQAIKFLLMSSLQVEPEDLHFIPKAGYHLDLFMMAGPEGKIFLQSYALCAEKLRELRAAIEEDGAMLERYILAAQRQNEEIGPILEKARTQLEAAGFVVIDTPGIFLDSPEGNKYNVNFLNAISGWSNRHDRPYLITAGAEVGTTLGKKLMGIFEQFVKQQKSDLKVYFIGKENSGFGPAMQLWNPDSMGLCPDAGPHCLTFEGDAFNQDEGPQ